MYNCKRCYDIAGLTLQIIVEIFLTEYTMNFKSLVQPFNPTSLISISPHAIHMYVKKEENFVQLMFFRH